ncbi:LacI family DNA-binding transcriptional regulator [Arthrobacter agilis]|uniref:LacI family DNA-binding transcriptional regulator n=1 Tax=Arthrobacter agilis TaxID=37921 RepID=UPI002366B2F9|nr:LacI family DNA-binding transcriptional regulator [Arthrobacter agilis]WDF33935.1 LacI family DNA-binding transcriptional regulator [Arthrobacter agilis]
MAGITSADVARESGVSRTTVSYVLTGRDGVNISEETRRRVRETAVRLGYAPSAAARALRTGRSDLVLCILPDWPVGPVIETLLDELADELSGRGLSVLVHHGRGARSLTDLWRTVTPRAVIGFAPFADHDLLAMRQAGIQVLGTLGEDDQPDPTLPSESQLRIGGLQAEHLARRRGRIGYAWPTDSRLEVFARDRLLGLRRACTELGLPEPVVRPVGLDVDAAADAVRAWRGQEVTGVAAYNDDVALAVLAGMRAEGLACPEDCAVIGVDDVPAARVAAPALTTVSQSIEVQARYLAALVLADLDGAEDKPAHPGHGLHVVERDSA